MKGECNFGEFSQLSDKKKVYAKLLKEVSTFGQPDVLTENIKNDIIQEVKDEMNATFEKSSIMNAYPDEYERFLAFINGWNTDSFAKSNELIRDNLIPIYTEYIYKQRNCCAHNTLSYQQDFLSFEDMEKPYMIYANYFTSFAVLLLIPQIRN